MSSSFTACHKGHLGGSGPGVVRKISGLDSCSLLPVLNILWLLPRCAKSCYSPTPPPRALHIANIVKILLIIGAPLPSLPLSDTLLLSWKGSIQFRFLPLYVSLPVSRPRSSARSACPQRALNFITLRLKLPHAFTAVSPPPTCALSFAALPLIFPHSSVSETFLIRVHQPRKPTADATMSYLGRGVL